MSYDYSVNAFVKEEKACIDQFINFLLDHIFPDEKHTYSIPGGNFYVGISTEIYRLNIGRLSAASRQFNSEDYGIRTNIWMTFSPYSGTSVSCVREMLKLLFLLMKEYDGDCILLPNGDYAAILRRNGELFLDTGKTFFQNVDLSLIDMPYTDILIDK